MAVADLRPGTARFDRGPYQVLLPDAERSGLVVLGRVGVRDVDDMNQKIGQNDLFKRG